MLRPRAWCALALVLTLIAGHAATVQLVAWAGMLMARSATVGWSSAVQTTFDGKHPCCLCKAARQMADDTAPKTPAAPKAPKTVEKKADTVLVSAPTTVAASVAVSSVSWPGVRIPVGSDRPRPEPPPPRRTAG